MKEVAKQLLSKHKFSQPKKSQVKSPKTYDATKFDSATTEWDLVVKVYGSEFESEPDVEQETGFSTRGHALLAALRKVAGFENVKGMTTRHF